MRFINIIFAGLLIAFPVAQTIAQTNQKATGDGPSSLQETYQDWQVVCSTREKIRSCVAAQQQSKKDNNQRVLVIEFAFAENNTISGTLIMPFGLLLADGITLQVDEKTPSKSVPFRTCLPVGCVVPLSLDKALLDALRGGASLKIKGAASDSGQPINLAVPLKGLAPALDRLRELVVADGINLRR